jgi:hypothetical protein
VEQITTTKRTRKLSSAEKCQLQGEHKSGRGTNQEYMRNKKLFHGTIYNYKELIKNYWARSKP